MKRLVICCILILALTNQAYAMGWLGGKNGGGGGSSASGSNSGKSTPTNSPTNTTNNSTTGCIIGGTDGQGPGAGITNNGTPNTYASAPELTTMFLLGSALFGLWGLRRKIKK